MFGKGKILLGLKKNKTLNVGQTFCLSYLKERDFLQGKTYRAPWSQHSTGTRANTRHSPLVSHTAPRCLSNFCQSQSGVEKKHVAVLRLMRKRCPVPMKLPALSTPLFTCLIQLPVNVLVVAYHHEQFTSDATPSKLFCDYRSKSKMVQTALF